MSKLMQCELCRKDQTVGAVEDATDKVKGKVEEVEN